MSEQNVEVSSNPEQGPSGVISVVMAGETKNIEFNSGESIFQAAMRQEVYLPSSCCQGYCGSCMAKLTEGRVRMGENHAMAGQELDSGYVLVCQVYPVTEQVKLEYGF